MRQGRRYISRLILVVLLMTVFEMGYAKQVVTVYCLDGRTTFFSLYTQQHVKELKILISRYWNIPLCNMRLTVGKEGAALADDSRIESLSRHDRVIVHDISSPLGAECQYYDHPPKL